MPTPHTPSRFHKTGPIRAARAMLGPESTATEQRITGRLLISDAVHGLQHPDDDRRLRPGILGALVALLITCVFAAIPVAILAQDPETIIGRAADNLEGLTAQSCEPIGVVRGPVPQGACDPDLVRDDAFGTDLSDLSDLPTPAVLVLYAFTALGVLAAGGALTRLLAKLAAIRWGRHLARTPQTTGPRTHEEVAALEEVLHRRFAGALRFSTGHLPHSSPHGPHGGGLDGGNGPDPMSPMGPGGGIRH